MSRLSHVFTAAILVLWVNPSAMADKPLKVFLFAGQSNMAGSGRPDDLPETMKVPSAVVLTPDSATAPTKWVPLKPGKRMGPEIAFCHTMAAQLKEPVGMVKFAVGGSNLAKQWNPAKDNNLYTKFRDRVQAAQKLGNIEIVAMLWMQGERDSRFEKMAAEYSKNLDKLVTRARSDFKSPRMIFVCGRVNPRFPVGKKLEKAPGGYPFAMQVRDAQENLKLPRTGWVDCDDLPKNNDVLHYNSKGLIEMGARMAGKVGEIVNSAKD